MENHTMDNEKLREMKSCNHAYDKIIRNSFQANICNDQTSKHHQIHGSNHDQLFDSKNTQIHVSEDDQVSESKHDHSHRAKP
ncbi:MAG: hypothetical protein ACK5WZ_06770, partial [Pseudobdellovibrionaceae bacterium]